MFLAAPERVLLHLYDHWQERDPSEGWTQAGIAAGAGLRRSHVPRALKPLLREGHVEMDEGRVRGRGRKVRLYRLTERGVRRAREILRDVKGRTVEYEGSAVTVAELCRLLDLSSLTVIRDTDATGVFRPTAVAEKEGFVDREGELAFLAAWHRSGAPVLTVYGAAGVGKTALAQAFLSRLGLGVAWVDIANASPADIAAALAGPLEIGSLDWTRSEEAGRRVAQALRAASRLLVLDGYETPPDPLVEWMHHLPVALAAEGAKALVLARETTPSYARFYVRDAVTRDLVRELRLQGLPSDAARQFLGAADLPDDAWRRIYLMTKGCPRCLELIRAGDAEGLRAHTRFTRAEANLLLFLRTAPSE